MYLCHKTHSLRQKRSIHTFFMIPSMIHSCAKYRSVVWLKLENCLKTFRSSNDDEDLSAVLFEVNYKIIYIYLIQPSEGNNYLR